MEHVYFPGPQHFNHLGSYGPDHSDDSCTVCANRPVVRGTLCCSKRCEWLSLDRCPQCGRPRDPAFTFCSHHCAGQSQQANWCHVCGVRQIVPGTNRCSFMSCQMAQSDFPARRSGYTRGQSFGPPRDFYSRHNWMPLTDKARTTAAAPFSKLGNVLGVIKINPDVSGKKRYLSYRANVEQVMSAARAAKYGHGGEGNEHRRFFPVPLTCPRVVETLIGSPLIVDSDSPVMTCGDLSCSICSVLRFGMSMERLQIPCHFSTSTADSCLKYCAPMRVSESFQASGVERYIAAVVIARAVVGVPQLNNEARSHRSSSDGHTDSEDSPEANAALQSYDPMNSSLTFNAPVTHCSLDIKPDGSDEMMFYRDDAVDSLFMVFVEY